MCIRDSDSTTIPLDPVVQTIQDSTEDQVVFAQSEDPIVTGEILNALRTTGKTPVSYTHLDVYKRQVTDMPL